MQGQKRKQTGRKAGCVKPGFCRSRCLNCERMRAAELERLETTRPAFLWPGDEQSLIEAQERLEIKA